MSDFNFYANRCDAREIKKNERDNDALVVYEKN